MFFAINVVKGTKVLLQPTVELLVGRRVRYLNQKSAHCLMFVAFRICKLWKTFFLSHSEYLKIFNGNGTEVFALSGWLWTSKKTIHEISFGESSNITIQVSLVRSWSYFKIDYGTLNQGLHSGKVESKISKSSYLWNYYTVVTITCRAGFSRSKGFTQIITAILCGRILCIKTARSKNNEILRRHLGWESLDDVCCHNSLKEQNEFW